MFHSIRSELTSLLTGVITAYKSPISSELANVLQLLGWDGTGFPSAIERAVKEQAIILLSAKKHVRFLFFISLYLICCCFFFFLARTHSSYF